MKRILQISSVVAASLGLALASAPACAQASRTWVSGVGDDVNPCSRTAPCKTFAGAISKTAAKGEINVLDPGGFGAVTITKSITIDGGGGSIAGILASGVNGVVVNAAPADKVVLRNLDINGFGTGLNGVRFLQGGALQLDNMLIYGFTQHGVDFEPSGAAKLQISNSIIHDNAQFGVFVKGASASATLIGVTSSRNQQHGLLVQDGAIASVKDSVMNENANIGIFQLGSGKTTIEHSVAARNGNVGVRAETAGSTIFMSETGVFLNATGLFTQNGGQIISFGNNRIAGNTTDGVPTSSKSQQ
jgi:hypothetical protein